MISTTLNLLRAWPKGLAVLFTASSLMACNGNSGNNNDAPGTETSSSAAGDSATTTKKVPEKAPEPEPAKDIAFTALPLKGNDSAKAILKEKYTDEQRYTIYALNRVDAAHYNRADTLIIPEKFEADFLAYSPFPSALPELTEVKKIVIFSYSIQAFAAYENGKLVKWGPTSMGSKSHPTPTGLSFANWKSKKSVSTVKDEWILPWNFNIRNKEGVGWHQYDLPGYPASHSCLRLLDADAQWLYQWAEQWILKNNQTLLANGTPVIVFGEYPWGQRRPWKNLLEHPDANRISTEMLKNEVSPHLEKIMAEQQRREAQVQQTGTDTART